MKKVLTIILISYSVIFSGTGWYSDYVIINTGSGGSYYWIGSNPSFGTEFNSNNFGTVSSFQITGSDMKYWSDTQDRTGGAFYWQIKSSDGSTAITSATEVVWSQSYLGGNDYQGTTAGLINVLSGLLPNTTYQIHIWAKSWGTNQGDSWLSNGSSNYVATFTTDASLPVELTSFKANSLKNSIELNWTTATEVNNYGFEILRSTNNNWSKIGFVQGNGNSNSPKNYSFTDNSAEGKKIQYKLKQIDFDGAFEYSQIAEVELETPVNFSVQQNFPNPFNPSTTIKYQIPEKSFVQVKIYDSLGKEVNSLINKNQEAGVYQITFDAKEYPSGIYFYSIQAGNYSITKKMLLIK